MELVKAAAARRGPRVQRAQAGAWKPVAALATRGPETRAVVLPAPIAAEDVRAPGDRFRCEPYGATFSGGTCVARQEVARQQLAQRGKPGAGRLFGDYFHCRECPVGAAIRSRLAS